MTKTSFLATIAVLMLALPLSATAQVVGPSAPGDLVATGANGAIALTWQAASSIAGVSAYRVYRGVDAASLALHAEVAGDQLAWTDSGLGNGEAWTYAVSAVDLVAEGPLSNAASAVTLNVPSAPTSVADAAGPGAIGEATITWAAPESDGGAAVTSYNVWRDGAVVATVDGATFAWTDTQLQPLHAYAYAVSAVNEVGEGLASGTCGMASPWTTLPDGTDCLTLL